MADISAYKAHQKMMKDPERRKAYIDAMKRRKKDTASKGKISISYSSKDERESIISKLLKLKKN